MLRMIIRFAILLLVVSGLAWIADRPGSVTLNWLDQQIEVPLIIALLAVITLGYVAWLLWILVSRFWRAPGSITGFFSDRRQRKGRQALSRGIIAVGAGDAQKARQNANIAQSILGDDPLTKVLQAQAAQMRGEHDKVRQLFQDMTEHTETELMGLRGLHAQALRDGDTDKAQEIARRAFNANPALPWASSAVLLGRSKREDWPAVIATLEAQRRAGTIDEENLRKQRSVVLTAQARKAEDADRDAALDLASRAHRLDPSLVPAAVIAGRIHAQQGNLRKASKILEKTWGLSPHPDLADVYIHARAGDSAQDRLKRMRDLLRVSRGGEEGGVALASAAIDAHDWKTARSALAEYTEAPRVRVCQLMAEIEEGEFGDKGRAREWLARAVRARRDPAWTADGHVSEDWQPVSPVSLTLGGFQWKVPVEGIGYSEAGAAEPAPEEPEQAAREPEADTLPGGDARDITPASPEPAAEARPAPAATADAPKPAGVTADTAAPAPAMTPADRSGTPPPAVEPVAEPAMVKTATGDGAEVPDEGAEKKAANGGETIVLADAAAADEEAAAEPAPRQPDDPGPDDEEQPAKTRWIG